MPQDIVTRVYQYDGLSPEAQEKAREWYIDLDNRYFDSDHFGECTIDETAQYCWGLFDTENYWSLSSCQGDGVAFYGAPDLDKFFDKERDLKVVEEEGQLGNFQRMKEIRGLFADMDILFSVTIEGKHGRYHHYNSMRPQVEIYDLPDYIGYWEGEKWVVDPDQVVVDWQGSYFPVDEEIPGVVRFFYENPTLGNLLIALDWLDEFSHLDERYAGIAHEYRIRVSDPEILERLREELEECFGEYLRAASHYVEKIGYEQLEYEHSEEYVAETIRINEYTFTASGKRFG